jgi:citrate lyase subunit beta/citryl-CoA lyase
MSASAREMEAALTLQGAPNLSTLSTPQAAPRPPRAPLRSLLFVPGDSERKIEKSAGSPAGALILDLEDSVTASRTAIARGLVLDVLKRRTDRERQQLWVRINPLDTPEALLDLCVVAGAPDGVMLPKVHSAAEVVRLAHYLDALEVREGIVPGSIGILPVATETPQALFTLGGYAGCSSRLVGLTWGAEDLAAAIGATTNRRPDGQYDSLYELARAPCLAGAAAARVQAIDTIWSNFADQDGLEADAAYGRRAGFTGKMAIHPGQVEAINRAFTPSEEELNWARQVVEAFDGHPGAGTVGLNGKMLDLPHLKQARRVLARSKPIGAR